MLSYLESQLFPSQNQVNSVLSLQTLNRVIQQLGHGNSKLESQIVQYEKKIENLPAEMRKKIYQNKYHEIKLSLNINQQQDHSFSPHSPSIYSSAIDKKQLQQKLRNLKQQQQQIHQISKISDTYLRCKTDDISTLSKFQQINVLQNEKENDTLNINQRKSLLEKRQLQSISEFIKSISFFNGSNHNSELVNELIENIKLHTGKKLVQKCQNLIHFGVTGNNQKVVIQKYLIHNCKQIIMEEQIQNEQNDNKDLIKGQKSHKIINNFISRILGDIIYYDVSYQKIILMDIVNQVQRQNDSHRQIISRKKIYFQPIDTSKHFDSIKITLSYHLEKVQQLKDLLNMSSSYKFQSLFDKLVEKYIVQIKANLEYILPYINIKSRKQIMTILTHGKQQVIEFEDLILRLKFKGQDGDMLMNNLQAVFNRLIEMNKNNGQISQTQLLFNDKNFDTLISFFQLGIFEAEQSLFQSSSKAFSKLTTSFSMRGTSKKSQEKVSHSVSSKKLFNLIFFSVSTLIDKLDVLMDQNGDMFSSSIKGQQYEDKINQWSLKFIDIRQSVRRKIHLE